MAEATWTESDVERNRSAVATEERLTNRLLSSGPTILVADDSEDMHALIRLYIAPLHARIESVSDGTEALAAAARRNFNLIVLDVDMPRMDGYSTARALRLGGYQGPLLAVTGHALKSEQDRAVAAGCTGYLAKPLRRELFMQTVLKNLALAGESKK